MIRFTQDPATLLQAFIRVILFIGIACVITLLSIAGKRSEEKYRLFAENSTDVIYLLDMTGKITYVSPSILRFRGYTPEEMVHKSFDQVICPGSLPVVMERMKKISDMVESGDVLSRDLIEVELPKKDGTTVWAEASLQVMYDDIKKPLGFLAVCRDISKRKKVEQALRESEKKFISIFEETPDPIIIIGPDMQIIEVNLGFEKVFGQINEEIKGKILEDTALINLASRIDDPGFKNQSKNMMQRDEMTLLNHSGAPFIAEAAISYITIQGKPCLLIQIHDIDEIRKAHNAVAQINQKLQILSSITRHDILNRVMVTSAYSEMLLEEVSDAKMAQRLEAIHISSEEIKGLIQFTGQYQELGSTEPTWQQVEVILKTRTIQGLISGITLCSHLGNLEIYADRMLEKVMYNLVENSIRHGKNLTHIGITSYQDAGDRVICYEDNGGGITEDEKEMVFKKGFGKNTGMGLFLIREILSITGISILENGEVGVGVRFEIRVPAGKFRIQE